MGYVPPKPPEDFGQQWIGEPPKWYRPQTPYRRYVWDLYGPKGRDWLPFINAGLLVSVIAFVAVVAWLVLG